jgi:hypothetical protein
MVTRYLCHVTTKSAPNWPGYKIEAGADPDSGSVLALSRICPGILAGTSSTFHCNTNILLEVGSAPHQKHFWVLGLDLTLE